MTLKEMFGSGIPLDDDGFGLGLVCVLKLSLIQLAAHGLLAMLGGVLLLIVWGPISLAWGWPLWRNLERIGLPQASLAVKLSVLTFNLLYGACWGVIVSGSVRLAG